MPFMTDGKRDYKKQGVHDAKPENIAHRAANVKQNRELAKKGIGSKGDGMDAGHKVAHSKGGAATVANTRLETPAKNRSFARNADSSMKSETSKKEKKK
jgi:hypothetical protein